MTLSDRGSATWRADLAAWPAFAPRVELEPNRTALLIVDMQNGYVRADTGMGAYLRERYPELAEYYLARHEQTVVPNLCRLLQFFREVRLPVVYVTFASHLPNHADWLPSRRAVEQDIAGQTGYATAVLRLGTWEAEVIDELRPGPDELVVNKVTRGAFNSTGLDQLLRNMGIEGLVVGGCITNVCVETTARDAVDRGFQCVLVDDACASFNPRFHEASLRAFAATFGAVRSTEEMIDDLRRCAAPTTIPARHEPEA
jgi:nicotinamidase-related amidase